MMIDQELVLPLKIRSQMGTRSSRRMRRDGDIPSVVYGLDKDAKNVCVEFTELRSALSTAAGRNAILTLDVDGDQEMGIVKDIQWHPYKEEVLHVDFLRINPDQDVTVEVPIQTVGDAHELTVAGGIIEQTLFELTVTTKPNLIPDQLEIDITQIQIGDSITVGDIRLPQGASTSVDPDTSVLQGIIPKIVEIEPEPEEEELEGEEAEGEGEGEADAEGKAEGDAETEDTSAEDQA